jgi:hypothetical protein
MPDEPVDLTGGLPDARLRDESRRKRTEVPGPFRDLYERVFCVNCGANGGAVTKEWTTHIFYLCEACAKRWGKLPLPEVPETVVRGA